MNNVIWSARRSGKGKRLSYPSKEEITTNTKADNADLPDEIYSTGMFSEHVLYARVWKFLPGMKVADLVLAVAMYVKVLAPYSCIDIQPCASSDSNRL